MKLGDAVGFPYKLAMQLHKTFLGLGWLDLGRFGWILAGNWDYAWAGV